MKKGLISLAFLKEKPNWQAVKIFELLVEISILGIIFLVPIVFSFFKEGFSIFELDKAVSFRVLLSLGILAYLAKIFILGEFKYRFQNIIFFLLGFLALSWAFSSFFSIHPAKSLLGSYDRQQGFLSLVFYLLFFLLVALNLNKWAQVKRILLAVLASSFFVSFYGLMQYFALDPFVWKEPAILTGRIFSSLGQPNFLGHFLILVIPLTVYSLIFLSRKLISRFFVLLLLVFELFCLVFTRSRAAWLGFLASLFFFIVFFLFVKKYKKTAWTVFLVPILLCLFVFFPLKGDFWPGESGVFERFAKIGDFESGSAKMRLDYWQASWTEFSKASPARKIFGQGPDALHSIFASWYRPSWAVHESINTWPDRAHNFVFDNLLQFGLAGLFFSLAFFIFLLKEALQFLSKRHFDRQYWLVVFCLSSLLAYFINNLFSFSLTVHFLYLYLILGILLFIVCREKEEKRVEIKLKDVSKVLIFICLLILVTVFIIYYNIHAGRADHFFMQAKKYKAEGDCLGFLYFNKRAIDLGPQNTIYKKEYIDRAPDCLATFFSVEAQDKLRENIIFYINSISPEERDFSLDLSIAYTRTLLVDAFSQSHYQLAEEDFSRLLDNYSNISTVYLKYAYFKAGKTEYDKMIDVLERGLKTLPDLDNPYFNREHKKKVEMEYIRFYRLLGVAHKKKQEADKALEYYQKVIRLNPHLQEIYRRIADIYYQEKDLEQALWYNKRGYMLGRDDYAWPLSIALLLEEIGRGEEAIAYAKEALKLSPDNKDIINVLKKLDQE